MASPPGRFRALSHYRLLPGIAGWPALVVAFLARTPYAMVPLGVMMAFTASTGNIAIGGMATGVASASTAMAAPLLGRVAEHIGQRPLLLVVIPINAMGLLGLFLISLGSGAPWYLWLLCVVTGATAIPVGSFTRARWVRLTTAPHQLTAAFSYESMADELVFVLGPALVGIAASAAMPSAPLGLAFLLMVIAGLPFAVMAPREVSATSRSDKVSIPRVIRAVVVPVAVLIAVGIFFGASQVGITQRAENIGAPGDAGLVYAVMGIGSAIAAILVVTIPDSIPFWKRLVVSALGMSAGMALIGFAGSLGTTTLLMAITGFFIGPCLVTTFSLAEKLAPPAGVTVAMTSMASSVTVGVALGSSLGGNIARALGADWAFWLAALAAALIVFLSLGARRVPERE